MASRNGLERWRGEVTERLREVKDCIDALPDKFEKLGERFEKALQDHAKDDREVACALDDRITAMEKSHSTLIGKATVIGVVFGATVSAIVAAAARELFD